MKNSHIAHHRAVDQKKQSVAEHLQEVAAICGRLARKAGAEEAGHLLGLLHDFGKYSKDFQDYIKSGTGILNPDIDNEYVDAKALKGKIDHSTAGAQWVWQRFNDYGPQGKLVGQMLAVCLASHHGGLLDCLKVDGKNGFRKRIDKEDAKTHLQECLQLADKELIAQLDQLATQSFLQSFCRQLAEILGQEKKSSPLVQQFRFGILTRFLFSCLIDADRINSADFEDPSKVEARSNGTVNWQVAIERMEAKNASFTVRNDIDTIRRTISDQCQKRAEEDQGIYTLTVPTGGGKTFSSMRYALHHAKKHKLEHIIYIIPFTSIIEQNAEEIRKVLEQEGDQFPWVLEHHSSLEPEELDWRAKLITENWDAPVIFTTMVQFLEVLFGGGTRGARRMHTLANSVLIFDEIQSLPINCTHLFCNALQFLVDHAGTTAVLCTATQPLLNGLKNPDKGQLDIPDGHELVDNMTEVFEQLKRVKINNQVRPEGWSEEKITELALEELEEKGSCLVVVNTKKWAQKLYERCAEQVNEGEIFHLSTSLCPAHRKEILAEVRKRLDDKSPVLCISTQLIEAGVDVDFNSVIRFLAGLDSIAQAAGRCNRNGNLPTAEVTVVNPEEEQIDMLEDIKIGRENALRILDDEEDANLLNPEVMRQYFRYYFYDRADLMSYPLNEKQAGRTDTLLSLLGDNHLNIGRTEPLQLRQSFKAAGRAFKAIDAPTQAVIVPYGEGKEIIADLCADYEPSKAYDLLKQAQQYSVNVFPNIWRKLKEAQAVHPVQPGEEIYCLDEQHYNENFGLSIEIVSGMGISII